MVGLIMAWLPDPKDFFKVNERELRSLIQHQCDQFSVPDDLREDLIQEFLFRVLVGRYKYDSSHRGRNNQVASVTTYMFACSRFFVMEFLKNNSEQQRRDELVEEGLRDGLEVLYYERENQEDLNVDFNRFLALVSQYPSHHRYHADTHAMFLDSLLMVGRGYPAKEVAQKHGISDVSISYARRFLRTLWEEKEDVIIKGESYMRQLRYNYVRRLKQRNRSQCS